MLSYVSKALCIVTNFLVLCSIYLSFSFVQRKKGLEHLIKETVPVFIHLIRFLQQILASRTIMFAPLFPFPHPFSSLKNCPRLSSKWQIPLYFYTVKIFYVIGKHVIGLKLFGIVLLLGFTKSVLFIYAVIFVKTL